MSVRPRVMATLDGYAVEGGFDRTGEPATCYSPTIALGRHAGPGDACALWSDYETVLDLAPTLGLHGVRLSIEWARIEPRRGEVNDEALARYRAVATHARSVGLRVSVALIDAAWPAWLGLEAWLLPWVEPYVVEHARRLVEALGAAVDGVVVFADGPGIVARGFVTGAAPPWRRRAVADAASATEQIRRIESTLCADDLVGPLVVARSRTLSLTRPIHELSSELADAGVDEVYLRSLVGGFGPTGSPVGLVSRDARGWRVSASDQLRALWA
ncbi:MAG TPA: family 1 glycosylhydrolase [Acidimicrobiales bacterium]|nr:family 1 glycosylhydrolase [Acidimicrobiales bacterium]